LQRNMAVHDGGEEIKMHPAYFSPGVEIATFIA
jgi:hypothetical protein